MLIDIAKRILPNSIINMIRPFYIFLFGIYRQAAAVMQHIITTMPGGLGLIVRRFYYSRKFKVCGSNLFIDTDVTFYRPENISVGDNVSIGKYGVFEAAVEIIIGSGTGISTGYMNASHGPIIIGENCLISRGVQMYAGTRKYANKAVLVKNQGYSSGKVIINNDVWIGANSYIGKDIVIGEGAVIGAGSMVNHDIKPYSVVAGVPAKIIKIICK